jgi:hypothetical protein
MSGAAKGKRQVNAQVTEQRAQYIEARARRLGWKPATFTSAVIDLWFRMGCPAVHEVEARAGYVPFSEEHL